MLRNLVYKIRRGSKGNFKSMKFKLYLNIIKSVK